MRILVYGGRHPQSFPLTLPQHHCSSSSSSSATLSCMSYLSLQIKRTSSETISQTQSFHAFKNRHTLDPFCIFLIPTTIPRSKTSIDTSFYSMSSDPASHRAENPHPLPTEPLPCPRCDSTNTKFCYYNNYNFSQPRHFCKSCRRYWTHGGTLRNAPIGGGSRKNSKRSHSASSSSYSATTFENLLENPISILAGVNLDSTCNHVSVYEYMNNGSMSFTTLLNSHNSGLLSLTGCDRMGHGVGIRAWSYPEVGDDLVGGYVGQNGRKVGEAENESLAWPELGISMQSKRLN